MNRKKAGMRRLAFILITCLLTVNILPNMPLVWAEGAYVGAAMGSNASDRNASDSDASDSDASDSDEEEIINDLIYTVTDFLWEDIVTEITTTYGTELEDIGLPNKLKAELGNSGKFMWIPVVWECETVYDSEMPGEYVFTAQVSAPYVFDSELEAVQVVVTVERLLQNLLRGAITLDLNGGSIVITAEDNGWSVEQGSRKIGNGAEVIIEEAETHTTNTIVVDGAGDSSHEPISITLRDVYVNISNDNNACAFELKNAANVSLTLEGENTLNSGHNKAGLQVPEGCSIEITERQDVSGVLKAYSKGGFGGGAGIGGGYGDDGGTIRISGGTVNGSSTWGAGFGGGANGAGGVIIISGGTVEVSDLHGKQVHGAGIGGGSNGDGGEINISGGTVTVNSESGAGIGGGQNRAGGKISISGGDVSATSYRGAGIGGGRDGAGEVISLSGGTVKATSIFGAGIGGGLNQVESGNIIITGGSIEAKSNTDTTIFNPMDAENGEELYLVTLTMAELNQASAVFSRTGLEDYGLNDVTTDAEGKLYFWLPKTTGSNGYDILLDIAGNLYVCPSLITVEANNDNEATLYITTVPGAPTELTATEEDKAITLSWTAPTDDGGSEITDYEYQLNEGKWVSTGQTSTNYQITGLTNGQSYSIRVRAVNRVGFGAESVAVEATLVAVPGAPTALTATEGDRAITFGWTAPIDNGGSVITDYEYQLDNGIWNPMNQTSTSYLITGLTNGQSYKFKVRAVNRAGSGVESEAIEAIPVAVPSAPTTLTATEGNEEITLNWTTPADNGGSEITDYEYQLDDGTWNPMNQTSTSYLITGLTNGQSYKFKVRAVNRAGSGVESEVIEATPVAVPSAPTTLTATEGNEEITFNWTAPTDNGGSEITDYEYQLDDGIWSSTDQTLTSYQITGLTNGQSYKFKVRAVNRAGSGVESEMIEATPVAVPSALTTLIVTEEDRAITLSWTAPADNGGSEITDYEYQLDDETWSSMNQTSTSYRITGLTNGQSYKLKVRAVNRAGSGVESEVIEATPVAVPSAPTTLTATEGNEEITLNWTTPADNGGSEITDYEYQLDDGIWSSMNKTTTSYRITGLTNGWNYKLKVRAVNRVGSGAESEVIEATPMAVPGAPTALTATGGNKEIILNWAAPTDNGGSEITDYEYQLDGGNWVSTEQKTTNFQIIGLTNGQSYSIQVRAVNEIGAGTASAPAVAIPAVSSASGSSGSDDSEVSVGTWIQDEVGWWLRRPNGTWPRGEWFYVNGEWYYFDSSGYIVMGWQKIGDIWYYLEESGAMKNGWIYWKGNWYYLGSGGGMLSDTMTPDGYWVGADGAWRIR